MSEWKREDFNFAGNNYTGPEGLIIYIKDGDDIICSIDTRVCECPDNFAENAAIICAAPLIPECEDKFELALPRLKNLCKYLTADSAEYKITQTLITEIYDILTALKAARGSDD